MDIRVKRGLKQNLPSNGGNLGELFYCYDSKEFAIGNGFGKQFSFFSNSTGSSNSSPSFSNWIKDTNYEKNSIVIYNFNLYLCLENNVSTDSFENDIKYWIQLCSNNNSNSDWDDDVLLTATGINASNDLLLKNDPNFKNGKLFLNVFKKNQNGGIASKTIFNISDDETNNWLSNNKNFNNDVDVSNDNSSISCNIKKQFDINQMKIDNGILWITNEIDISDNKKIISLDII